jgi:hypothetical protein
MNAKHFLLSVLLTIAAGVSAFGGIKWADIGVNGLTCSMCSRSVEMSVRRLDFVDRVDMSLETTEGRIYFKPGALIDLNQLARAVVNAGFSVRFVRLEISFDDITLNKDGSFVFQGQPYQWLDFHNPPATQAALKLVDENFLPRKERALWKKKIGSSKSGDQRILHVVDPGQA